MRTLNTNKFSLFILLFVVLGFLLLLTPETGIAQGGCCRTPDNAFCLGCDKDCAATENYCEEQGGLFIGATEACVSEFGDCGSLPDPTTGCCLAAPGACAENLTFDQCFGESNGQFWNANESCSVVPDCQEARPIPTMNQWGLIALVIVLGVSGILFYQRRKGAA